MAAHEHDPQHAVGRTVAEVNEYGWTLEIVFTDDTKLMITPDHTFEPEGVETVFYTDRRAD